MGDNRFCTVMAFPANSTDVVCRLASRVQRIDIAVLKTTGRLFCEFREGTDCPARGICHHCSQGTELRCETILPTRARHFEFPEAAPSEPAARRARVP